MPARVITASHNPLDWNGLKFVINGRGLYENELDTMLDRVVQQQSTNFGRSVRGFSSDIEELLELAQSMQLVEEIKIGLDPGGVSGLSLFKYSLSKARM